MDIVHGTVVKFTYMVTDLDTGQPTDPPDTSVTVTDVAGTTQTVLFSNAEIARIAQGQFRAEIDTTQFSLGGCVFEIASLGPDMSRYQDKFFLIANVGP